MKGTFRLNMILIVVFLILGVTGTQYHQKQINNQNEIIIAKQNQIIILLSKDYPELQINSIKEKKRIPKKEKDKG